MTDWIKKLQKRLHFLIFGLNSRNVQIRQICPILRELRLFLLQIWMKNPKIQSSFERVSTWTVGLIDCPEHKNVEILCPRRLFSCLLWDVTRPSNGLGTQKSNKIKWRIPWSDAKWYPVCKKLIRPTTYTKFWKNFRVSRVMNHTNSNTNKWEFAIFFYLETRFFTSRAVSTFQY